VLKQLSVQNYALIDQLQVELPEGLTIITGETGAGKSILLGALALILGERADTQSLQDKSKKCVVEGLFNIKGYGLKELFKLHELDHEEITSIRREINPEGKSRAFVNDTPVTLAVLKELRERLIDVHSQHETLTLNDSGFQLSVVDAYAKHADLLDAYREEFAVYKKAQHQLNELLAKEAQSKKDQDYFQFQFNELNEADLDNIRLEELEQELELLNNSESIKSTLTQAENALDGGESGLLQALNSVKALLSPFAKFNKELAALSDRLSSSFIELKDISNELSAVQANINYDPKRINELNAIIDETNRLLLKHRVKTTTELLLIKAGLEEQLQGITTMETQIISLQSDLAKFEKSLRSRAERLSKSRGEAAPKIEKEISKKLAALGMPDARLEVGSLKLEELSPAGLDKITLLFSANKGSAPKELNKVASGGELSRLMLSIKSLIAKLTQLPTIIFDEIDTGVSGDVADKVGMIMETMGGAMQVIAITHLPQIASKGDSHLFVYKEVKQGKTYTRIKMLDRPERVKEIAKMLSTENPTDAAINNAKELLRT
jgi:DNA repair protein RecN (Recombination protein N)